MLDIATHLMNADCVRPVIDVEVIVAIELQHVEPQHEALQDGVRLKGDDTVQVALVLRPEHSTVDFPVQLLQEMVFAQR